MKRLAELHAHELLAIECSGKGGVEHSLTMVMPASGRLTVTVLPERAAYWPETSRVFVSEGDSRAVVVRERGVYEGRALVLVLVLAADSGPLWGGES